MIFEFLATYGWKKEYIFDHVTLPQVTLYLDSYGKRKKLELQFLFGKSEESLPGEGKEFRPSMDAATAKSMGLGFETES